MVDCLVCGYDINDDKRLGAIQCTLHPHMFLFVKGIIKALNGITSCTSSSSSVIGDSQLIKCHIYYIIGYLG